MSLSLSLYIYIYTYWKNPDATKAEAKLLLIHSWALLGVVHGVISDAAAKGKAVGWVFPSSGGERAKPKKGSIPRAPCLIDQPLFNTRKQTLRKYSIHNSAEKSKHENYTIYCLLMCCVSRRLYESNTHNQIG